MTPWPPTPRWHGLSRPCFLDATRSNNTVYSSPILALSDQLRCAIAALGQKYAVRRLDLIGSALRDDFDPSRSDVDFVVEFAESNPTAATPPMNPADRYFGLLLDLEDLLGRPVDLVSYRAIRNPHFRKAVDATRVSLYAA